MAELMNLSVGFPQCTQNFEAPQVRHPPGVFCAMTSPQCTQNFAETPQVMHGPELWRESLGSFAEENVSLDGISEENGTFFIFGEGPACGMRLAAFGIGVDAGLEVSTPSLTRSMTGVASVLPF